MTYIYKKNINTLLSYIIILYNLRIQIEKLTMRECSWKCYAIYNKDTSDITLYRLPTFYIYSETIFIKF